MHHAVAVNVVERVQNLHRELDGALRRQLLLFMDDVAQQPALHPLHHHVDLAAGVVSQHLHHAGMIQHLADLRFALEALEQHRIGLPSPDAES